MSSNPENPVVYKLALSKLTKLCSSKEICTSEASKKLDSIDISECDKNLIITYLTENKYINDRRYTAAFVNDKIRFQKWGHSRIKQELSRRKISFSIIEEAISLFDKEEYEDMMKAELLKKQKIMGGINNASDKARLFRFGASRGYDMDFLYRYLNL